MNQSNATIPYHKVVELRGENVTTAQQMRTKGYSYAQIGRVLGVSKMTAYNYINNYGKQTGEKSKKGK